MYEKKSLVKEPAAKSSQKQQQQKKDKKNKSNNNNNNNSNNKKKDKTTVLKTIREDCYCMGLQHPVLGNCTSCGKIICELEGKNLPCLFCGEMFTFNMISEDKSLKDAVSRKNVLLAYEKSSVARSLVYDDQADYFNSDSQWMSKEEKKHLKEKEQQLREEKEQKKRALKITLDIFGRRIIVSEDEAANASIYQPFNLQELLPKKKKEEVEDFDATNTNDFIKPSYVESKEEEQEKNKEQKKGTGFHSNRNTSRVQHVYFEVEEEEQEQQKSSSFHHFGVYYKHDGSKLLWSKQNVTSILDAGHSFQEEGKSVLNFVYPLQNSEKMTQVLKEGKMVAICLDLSQFNDLDAKYNTLAKYHGALVNEILSQKPEKSKMEVWVKPFHHELKNDYSVCRKYWNELNEVLRKQVIVVLTSSLKNNPIITKETIKSVKNYFGTKRSLVLIDDCLAEPFHPFTGRQHGLDLKGMFCVSSNEHNASEIGILGALDYFRDDVHYDVVDSVKRVLTSHLGPNEVTCMLELLHASPSNLRTQAENEAFLQQLNSKRRLEELSDCVEMVRHSKTLKLWLKSADEFEMLERVLLTPIDEVILESRKALIMKEGLSRKARREKIEELKKMTQKRIINV